LAALRCPVGIVITDPSKADNPIVFVNPAFTELMGCSPAEAVGQNCRFSQARRQMQEILAGNFIMSPLPVLFAELVRMSKTNIAVETDEEHRRRVPGD
jgi:PAS domain-containing protein